MTTYKLGSLFYAVQYTPKGKKESRAENRMTAIALCLRKIEQMIIDDLIKNNPF